MIKKVFQIGVVASLMVAVNLAWAAGTELRGVHVSAIPGGTQVTLDLTAATGEKLFTLDHPRRAVIDLGHTRLGATCACLSERELCRAFGSGRSLAARCVSSCN